VKPKGPAKGSGRSWDAVGVEVDRLQLDGDNPRLAEYGIDAKSEPEEILETLWRLMAVDEIALSIWSNGFFPYEPLFAEQGKGTSLVVVEGNRRLAAVMLLRSPTLQKKLGISNLPTLTPSQRSKLDTLPVIVCPREKLWEYLGFKHVNGPQNWESFAKAEYIAWVHNMLGQPLDKIAEAIGDRHATVLRLYNGVQTLNQAETAKVFERNDRYKNHFSFSHLYTGLGYSGIQAFLDLDEADFAKENPVPKAKTAALGELLLWLYGSKTKQIPPLVQSQNPDLRQLDEAIQSERGLAAVRSGLPLKVALDISRGDDLRFREAMVGAKERLQIARGALLTGYLGDVDLLEVAREVALLADNILREMTSMVPPAGKKPLKAVRRPQ
jgi:hypothetical protein